MSDRACLGCWQKRKARESVRERVGEIRVEELKKYGVGGVILGSLSHPSHELTITGLNNKGLHWGKGKRIGSRYITNMRLMI